MKHPEMRRGDGVRSIDVFFEDKWIALGDLAGSRWGNPDNGKNRRYAGMAEGLLPLFLIAPTAPHECDPDCPGDRNRRKLALYEEMVGGLTQLLDHVEDETVERKGGQQCTLCFTYRELARALLARAREITEVPQ